MPIVHEYRPAASVRARAAAAGYGAAAIEDQRRYNDQQARLDRQFAYQAEQADLDNQYRAAGLQQQRSQFNQQHALKVFNAGMSNDLAWAKLVLKQAKVEQGDAILDQESLARQMRADAGNRQMNAAIEQQRMRLAAAAQQRVEEQKINQAVRWQDAIMKAASDGRINTQAQWDAAVQQFEAKTGMAWNFPQRSIAEQQLREGETRRQNFVNAHANMLGLDPAVVHGLTVDTEAGPMIPDKTLASLTSIATAKMNNERMLTIDENELKEKGVDNRHTYDQKARDQHARMMATYRGLLESAAKAASTKGDAVAGVAPNIVTPESLPREVRAKLLRQAMAENPPPVPLPGM